MLTKLRTLYPKYGVIDEELSNLGFRPHGCYKATHTISGRLVVQIFVKPFSIMPAEKELHDDPKML